jgi:hypothetical protein
MDVRRRIAPRASHGRVPHPNQVIPFGRQGAGLWTGHPLELVIVVGLLLIGFIGLPEARWFFALAVPLGGIYGFFLWRRHR